MRAKTQETVSTSQGGARTLMEAVEARAFYRAFHETININILLEPACCSTDHVTCFKKKTLSEINSG